MKLRNKKTGEIGELKQWLNRENRSINGVGVYISADKPLKQYNSLAELNAEWEDYEDDDLSKIIRWIDKGLEDEILPVLVNDFVEKLKAWKRLKDKGISLNLDTFRSCIDYKFDLRTLKNEEVEQLIKDLTLLFGGKE